MLQHSRLATVLVVILAGALAADYAWARAPENIETGADAPVVAPSKNFWYFCPDAGGYYPYVEECAEGWELVAPPGAVPMG